MPFTLSHPAAILPLRRLTPWPISALVIGSMAPDFPYFLFIHSKLYHVGHSVPGVFTFCLPAGLLVFIGFHALLKAPALSLLPVRHQQRLFAIAGYAMSRRPTEWLWTAAALVAGAFTHLMWDSFTHANGWSVVRLPFLALSLPHLRALPVYKVLQYGSSIIGAVILATAYRRWFQNAPPVPISALPPRLNAAIQVRLVAATLGVAVLLACLYTFWEYRSLGGYESLKRMVAEFVETMMTTMAAALVVFSVRWHLHRRGAQSESTVSN